MPLIASYPSRGRLHQIALFAKIIQPSMTALFMRPVPLRLQVAMVVDAAVDGFPKTHPSNSLERILTDNFHPYQQMWNAIGNYYEQIGWAELCDQSLASALSNMKQHGFLNSQSKFIEGYTVANSIIRWKENGWYDYEMQKASKTRKLTKWGTRAVLLAIGVGGGMNAFEGR
jgi:hypothetical protein